MTIGWNKYGAWISIAFMLIYPFASLAVFTVIGDRLDDYLRGQQLLVEAICILPGAGVLLKHLIGKKWKWPAAVLATLIYGVVMWVLSVWFNMVVICPAIGGACH